MALLDFSSSLETRSDAEPGDPSVVGSFISDYTTTQYFNVAFTTVLVYHSVITFDKEVRYFWPKPRSSVSIIYFVNRYIGILSAVCNITVYLSTESLASCRGLVWTTYLANLISVLLIEYILLIRVSALFYRDKRLDISLKVLLGLEACMDLGILIYGNLYEGVAIVNLGEGMTFCAINRNPPWTSFVPWLVTMTYGMILLVLALYKAAEYWKLSSGFKGFRLVRILVQDQVIYYGFVTLYSVSKIVYNSIIESNPFAALVVDSAGSPTLLCVLGGQLLINLKEAGERGANGGTNYTPTGISNINFGENGAVDERSTGRESSV